jgi:transposase
MQAISQASEQPVVLQSRLLENPGRKEGAVSEAELFENLKHAAVAQVEDAACPVREVAGQLRVSTKSIYQWQKLFSPPAKLVKQVVAQAEKIARLKRDLARGTKERTILNKAAHTSRGNLGKVCLHTQEQADPCGQGHLPDATSSSERLLWMAARSHRPRDGQFVPDADCFENGRSREARSHHPVG